MQNLREIELEITRLKALLSPWVGMTAQDAANQGWGETQDELLARLWEVESLLLTAYNIERVKVKA